jgi:23S rRNA (uracil1939-C5)-methyltransferase
MFHVKQERNTLQKDALYTARIDGFNSEGLGVCHIEGWAVFVPNAIAGETCRLRIVRVGKHFAEARIDTILERSPHRVNRLCPDAKQCGGCDFWHMDYETELSLKSQRVSDALQRIGGAAAVQVPILPGGVGSPAIGTRRSFRL